MSSQRSLAACLILALGFLLPGAAHAQQQTHAAVADPAGLGLRVSPAMVDVGNAETLTVVAQHFPQGTAVTVSFLSLHHGFSGKMLWTPQCKCFRLNVLLAKRAHGVETAKAKATVTVGGKSYVRTNHFDIRGLLPDLKHYAPGGTPYLAGWISDPQPVQNEALHFCAWTRALDSFPISGIPVSFVVHFQSRKSHWYAGLTGPNGVRCSVKNIYHAKVGVPVKVDVYAGKLHTSTTFTPRA
jgi:hypothetical protein